MKHYLRQIPHYTVLFGILIAAAVAFALFSYDRVFQLIITIALAVSYVAWGLIHHHIHRDLYLRVVIEYIAVATLGLVIIFSIILRA